MPAAGQVTKPLVRLPKSAATSECWPWLGAVNEKGYPIKQHCGQTMGAQRWLWMSLFGPIDHGLVISTTCGDVACMNPGHFEARDVAAVNQETRSGLLPADVIDIRKHRDRRQPDTARRLAEKHMVDPTTIYKIWRGRSWKKPGRKVA